MSKKAKVSKPTPKKTPAAKTTPAKAAPKKTPAKKTPVAKRATRSAAASDKEAPHKAKLLTADFIPEPRSFATGGAERASRKSRRG